MTVLFTKPGNLNQTDISEFPNFCIKNLDVEQGSTKSENSNHRKHYQFLPTDEDKQLIEISKYKIQIKDAPFGDSKHLSWYQVENNILQHKAENVEA